MEETNCQVRHFHQNWECHSWKTRGLGLGPRCGGRKTHFCIEGVLRQHLPPFHEEMATNQSTAKGRFAGQLLKGGLFIFGIFLRQVLELFLGSWFYAFLLLCFSAFCFSCFSACLLLCFTCFFAFPLLCFCAFLLLLVYFFFLQSCVFAALLPAPLVLCFLSLLPLCFVFSFALFSPVCKHPRWNPKKPERNPDKNSG